MVTQTLNHNIKSESFSVKHKVTLTFKLNSYDLKPLMGKTVIIMLPYNENKPFDNSNLKNPNLCIPIETKNHNYLGDKNQHIKRDGREIKSI